MSYKLEPHNHSGKICGKTYCTKCGLVYLNNEFSRWYARMGCNADEHPNYKLQRDKAGGAAQ